MSRFLIALLIALVPSLAPAQIRYYPPPSAISSDGSFTIPLAGPTGCPLPAYAFAGDTDTGRGSASAGTMCDAINGVTVVTWTATVATATINWAVPDDAYAVGWNGSANVPTKNAVFDKIETVISDAANASNLSSGTVPDGRFPATLPAASGVNLTALNASNLASGTVPNARLSGAFVPPRVVTVADATTITPNVDTTDLVHQTNTQGAGTLTIANPTGTPVAGQVLIIRVKSTNSHTLSWGANFRGSTTLTLTTTNSAAKSDYFAFRWNAVDSKWDFLAENLGF